MKIAGMTTMATVLENVEAMSLECYDELVPIKDLSFEGLGSLQIGDSAHPLRPVAQRSFAARLGIPLQYLQKCPVDVQAYNLNHWLYGEKNDRLYLRFQGDAVRAVFTPRYKPADNYDIIQELDTLGYGRDTVVQCHLDPEFMLLSIPDPEREFALKGNDAIRPGISIGNSEVGLAALSVSAFMLRLVCTNGLIGKTEVSSSFRHVSVDILENFRANIEKSRGNALEQGERLRYSATVSVAQPETTLKSFNRQFVLGKSEVEAVEWAWIMEQGETMFHIVNTYTKASQYAELSAEASYRLQRIGGMILAMMN